MQYFNEVICGNCWNRYLLSQITPKHLNGFYMMHVWYEMRFLYYLKGRKSCGKKCRTHKCPSNYRNFSRATFLFVLLFIYLFIYLLYLFVYFFVCVSERFLSATFTWIIIFFCLTFSGWDTWNVTLQASNLKQTLTINNISTIFLLKPMPSNTIQAFNVFERY